jgi:DNA-binding NarL/FixJ family response regulator
VIRVFLITGYRSVLWGLERLIESREPTMQVVGSATSCAEALELIGDAVPDLILLDTDLDTNDSMAAIAKLKASAPAQVLVLTGVRNGSLPEDVVLAGASGVVRKESPAEEILEAIEAVHQGQLWLDRVTAGRVLAEILRRRTARGCDPDQAKIASLTAREREIVVHAVNHPSADGETLARMLNISLYTLRNHLTSIYVKLDLSNRLAMFAFAYKHGIISVPPVKQSSSPGGRRRRPR